MRDCCVNRPCLLHPLIACRVVLPLSASRWASTFLSPRATFALHPFRSLQCRTSVRFGAGPLGKRTGGERAAPFVSEDRLGGVGSLREAEEEQQRCLSPFWFYGRVSLLPAASGMESPPQPKADPPLAETRRWSERTGGPLHNAYLRFPTRAGPRGTVTVWVAIECAIC